MKALPAVFACVFMASIVGLRADDQADAIKKLSDLPSAPMIITMDQAKGSPSVVLTDKGAMINQAKAPIPFDQVLGALAALPKDVWPFGRVVLYNPEPVGLGTPPKSVADGVEADLQKAGIRVLRSSS
jgi:hypothetical protein